MSMREIRIDSLTTKSAILFHSWQPAFHTNPMGHALLHFYLHCHVTSKSTFKQRGSGSDPDSV